MIVCSKCGTQNQIGTRFCERCGNFLDWEDKDTRVPEPATAAVSASLRTPDIAVEPGAQSASEIEVHNDGSLVDEYWLQVEGPDQSWCSVEPASLKLMPRTSATARVLFRPPRASSPAAGTIPFVVTVKSAANGGIRVSAAGSVTISRFAELDAKLVPPTSESTQVAEHSVRIENRGNSPDKVTLSVDDPDYKLANEVTPSELTVPPGSTRSSNLRLWQRNPKEPRGGRRLPFQVVVQPLTGTPIRLDGATVLLERQPSWWARWRLAIAAALLLTVVGGGVAFAGPPYPHWPLFPQTSPSPNPTPVAQIAKLSVTPPTLKFGTVAVGAGSAATALTIANSGNAPTQVTAKLSDGNDYSIQDLCSGSPLGANQQCEIQIAFTPKAEGEKDATITFSAGNANTLGPVTLTGFGQGHALLSCTPPSVSITLTSPRINGGPVPLSGSQGVTCTNSGNGAMTISSVVLQDPSAKFSQSSDCGGKALSPNTSCTIQVQFSTSTFGQTFNASLLINSSLGQQIVPVTGWRGQAVITCIVCGQFTLPSPTH